MTEALAGWAIVRLHRLADLAESIACKLDGWLQNRRAAPGTCQLCYGTGWIPGVAWPVGPLDELPCPECSAVIQQR
jgi:hypothetical protein